LHIAGFILISVVGMPLVELHIAVIVLPDDELPVRFLRLVISN